MKLKTVKKIKQILLGSAFLFLFLSFVFPELLIGILVIIGTLLVVTDTFYWNCPHCHELLGRIDWNAKYCPHCGKELDL